MDINAASATDSTMVTFFYVGLSVTIMGIALTVAGWKHKAIVWGLLGLAGVLFLLAFTWQAIATAAPPVGSALTAIARADVLWFLAILVALGMGGLSHRRMLSLTRSGGTQIGAAYDDSKLRTDLDSLGNQLANLDARSLANDTALQSGIDKLRAEMIAHQSLGAEELERRVSDLLLSFEAIEHREKLNGLAIEIEQIVNVLIDPLVKNQPVDATVYANWCTWEGRWRLKVEEWCAIADHYRDGVFEDVFHCPEERYRDEEAWTISDAQFPAGSNAVHAYKSFCIILDNWRSLRAEIDPYVADAAFHGLATVMRTDQ